MLHYHISFIKEVTLSIHNYCLHRLNACLLLRSFINLIINLINLYSFIDRHGDRKRDFSSVRLILKCIIAEASLRLWESHLIPNTSTITAASPDMHWQGAGLEVETRHKP